MKKFKKLMIALIVLVACLLAAVPVSAAVKISAKNVTLIKGQSRTLKITGTKSKAKWSSSKKSVATVTSKGKVTAKNKGTATITAKVGKKKYTCKVKVETPKISKTELNLAKGKTATLKVSGTSQKVKWNSSNKKIATVTSKGKVKGVKAGSCKITATVGGKKYSCKVTVTAKKTTPEREPFSKSKAIDKISYTVQDISENWSVMYMVTNNYNYNIGLRVDAYFYDAAGNVIDMDCDEAWCIEPGGKYPLFVGKPVDREGNRVNYANMKLVWDATDMTGEEPREKLRHTENWGNDKLIINLQNTSDKELVFRMVVIAYLDGEIVDYCQYGAFGLNPKQSTYLDYDYGQMGVFDPDRKPEKYEIYVG